ncbi:hypothetical protein [Belliella aquatica]|uniref:Uncharacterized protein n=1 Tax=Belliella aquatica TaxID=1323734 RepID=A0ABQ1LZJ4_9BACT|nr:hypothetical protein [Belliella aquatica]MCH7406841.1 hypothetical protein [Belliella aquatica]GGC32281.1 hypothetical protein GCM10010993_09110 [Belliella aquatica]
MLYTYLNLSFSLTLYVLILLSILYYALLIPLFFKKDVVRFFTSVTALLSPQVDMNAALKEYREWLDMVRGLRPDQKVKAIQALENAEFLNKTPFKSQLDLDEIWKEHLERLRLQQIKNQNQ